MLELPLLLRLGASRDGGDGGALPLRLLEVVIAVRALVVQGDHLRRDVLDGRLVLRAVLRELLAQLRLPQRARLALGVGLVRVRVRLRVRLRLRVVLVSYRPLARTFDRGVVLSRHSSGVAEDSDLQIAVVPAAHSNKLDLAASLPLYYKSS